MPEARDGGGDDVFVAIASPVRRAVLDMLRERPRPVREIASAFPISRPAVSQHLAVLRDARLVAERHVGREHYYELDASRLAEVNGWLAEYETFWKAKLRNLRGLLDEAAESSPAAGSGAVSSREAER